MWRCVLWTIAMCAVWPGAADGRVVEFAPHVRIDWHHRRVEIDAAVVLRDGLLELLLCRPQTREHESLLVTPATAVHLYQALGLLGLEPGQPPSWDAVNERVVPASGAPLRILVREGADPEAAVHDIEQWLWNARDDGAVARQQWVFSGSMADGAGGLGADPEGTLLSVVDFPTALVSAAASYSDRNDLLWLVPAVDAVPQPGTRCTVLLAPVGGTHRVSLDASGQMRYDGLPVDPGLLAEWLHDGQTRGPAFAIERDVDSGAPPAQVAALDRVLEASGAPRLDSPTRRAAAAHAGDGSSAARQAAELSAVLRSIAELLDAAAKTLEDLGAAPPEPPASAGEP